MTVRWRTSTLSVSDRVNLRNYLFARHNVSDVLLRAFADLLTVGFGFTLAFLLWVATASEFDGMALGDLVRRVDTTYLVNVAVFSVACLASFLAGGVYGHVVTFRVWPKVLSLGRAVVIAMALHLVVVRVWIGGSSWQPTLALISGVIIMALVAATRLGNFAFRRRYQVVLRSGRRSSKVEHVLVIGGAGYLGSVLVRVLLDLGYRVRVLDSLVYGDDAVKELIGLPGFELVVGDFRNVEAVAEAVRGTDAVILLGAIVGDPACQLDPEITVDVNYLATRMIHEVCKGFGIQRFLFASTCSVYGASDSVLDEESPVGPLSVYAASKVASEQAVLQSASDAFHPTILRIATAFGWSHRPRFDLVVNLLTAKAVLEGEFDVYNGEQWRPFIHVKDIARAFAMFLEAPVRRIGGKVYNVGDDRNNMALSDLGKAVVGATGGEMREMRVQHDLRSYRVSFDRIRRDLGFTCKVSVAEGIEEVAAKVRELGLQTYRDAQYSNVLSLREGRLAMLDRDFGPSEIIDELLAHTTAD